MIFCEFLNFFTQYSPNSRGSPGYPGYPGSDAPGHGVSISTSFQMEKSQIVAPLTKIVAFFEEKNWGAFWRFSARKRALPDSEHLDTLLADDDSKPLLFKTNNKVI